jgi:hypothetical protein
LLVIVAGSHFGAETQISWEIRDFDVAVAAPTPELDFAAYRGLFWLESSLGFLPRNKSAYVPALN